MKRRGTGGIPTGNEDEDTQYTDADGGKDHSCTKNMRDGNQINRNATRNVIGRISPLFRTKR